MNWQTIPSGRKRCSLVYLENPLLSGKRATLPTILPWKMSAKYSLLDFQLDETSSDTEWKWNIVSEELDRKIETIYTVSEERLNKAGPMI